MTLLSPTLPSHTRLFTDLDLSFTAHPVTGDINVLSGDAAVIQSVENLVLMSHYDKKFQPSVGSGVYNILFEPLTPTTATTLQSLIENVLSNYEPRVRVVSVDVSTTALEQNTLEVT